ncbi:uncharacterized protein [Parasteatoda tepidariorum]|uniref:uncharacterized protein n=1 Tax=Parasteatoda tepidariorum TaxID=114398 RepID=UPI0039BD19DF
MNLYVEAEEKFGDKFLYFSSYERILRTTAWVLIFINNIKPMSTKLMQALSGEEIKRAEESLIKIIQSEWPSEIRESYSRSMRIYEHEGILKVESKLILGEDPDDFVLPIVLPDHPITRRMIEYFHKKYHHTGVQATLTHLRERFWIP